MTIKSTLHLLLAVGMLAACGCGANDDGENMALKQKHKTVAAPAKKYNYAIYLENSGSVNGYLNALGDGNFKDEVYSMITEISGFDDKRSLNLYDINTEVIPVAANANAEQVIDYITNLDESTFRNRSKANGGDQGKSDLSAIIRRIIDTTADSDVSILISDCIFSPGKSRSASDFLANQGKALQIYMMDKLDDRSLSTLVLQFTSDFEGIYFDQNDARVTGSFRQRPYYFVCFGNEEALRHLLGYVKDGNRFKGFRNFLFLTHTKSYNVGPRLVGNDQYYKYDADHPLVITEGTKAGPDNKFRIVCDVDFARLPVDETYLRDKNNYTFPEGYRLDAVAPSNKKGATHRLTLVADKVLKGEIHVTLKKQLPQWIESSNVDTDTGLTAGALEGKTFGIRYLLNGMFLAYDSYSGTPNYFTFSISVKD